MDRGLVPTYLFSKTDIIVTPGQDGLVANTAKYVSGQPILAVNPDAERFDGVLLPFQPQNIKSGLEQALAGKARIRAIALAEARLKITQEPFISRHSQAAIVAGTILPGAPLAIYFLTA